MCVFFFLAALCSGQMLDLKSLDRFASKASDTVDVHLEGPMLKMAAGFLSGDKADEAQVKKIVEGLTGVYVKSFEFAKSGEFTDADLDGIRSQLKPPVWSRIVSVKSQKDGESSEVYMRATGKDQVGGLAVIALDAKELTVVQVLGSIRLSDLGALSAIPGIPDVRMGPRQKEENK
ncbi:MAG: hypothetical protein JWO80_5540 [Bryobacterales bacterium]|nr:hypothetical protein [Bryobacterales bacterium]